MLATFLFGIVFPLRELVPKIDKNGDKKISEEELKEWIQNVSKNSIKEDAKRQFEALSPKTKEGKVLFETYSSQTLGKPGIWMLFILFHFFVMLSFV